MKQLLFFVILCSTLANALQYNIYDINGKNRGSFNKMLDKNSLIELARKHHGSILVKRESNEAIKAIKNINFSHFDNAESNFNISHDSSGKDIWIEVEKNATIKLCIDKKVLAWETAINSKVINDSCLMISAPTIIGVEKIQALFPDSGINKKINLAIGMKYFNFKNEEALLGYNVFSEEVLKMIGYEQNEDPERLVSFTGTLLVDKYPVTNCEFMQLMWDDIPDTSTYEYDVFIKQAHREWLSRKKHSIRNGACAAHDTAANSVSLYLAMKYANARSLREGLTPYYNFSTTNKEEEYFGTNSYVIEYWDFTDHKKNHIWVSLSETSDGYRLPYYDEWMMLARAGDKTNKFYWGDSATFEEASKYAKFNTTSAQNENYTELVGQVKPNKFGLYDMFGLVRERVLLKSPLYFGNTQHVSCLKGGGYRISLKDSSFHSSTNWKSFNYGYYSKGSIVCSGFRLIRNIGNNAKWENIESGSK